MKFSQDEFKVIGEYTPEGITAPSIPKYNTPITPKENFLRIYRGEKPEWIPMTCDSIVFTPKIISDNIARGMVNDVDKLEKGKEGGLDMFGIEWEFVPQVNGSMVKPGNPILEDANDWEKVIKFPNLDDYDWQACADRNRGIYFDTDRVTFMWIFNGMFERLISFMECQYALIALVDDDQKDAVKALFDRLCDFYDELIDKYATYFHPEVIHFHDDWGSQRAALFSYETCEEMIAPYIKRVVESCHKRGIYFDFHCCGKNEALVPLMIECGVDSWGGQLVNDFDYLYDNYGDKIILGITPDKVRQQVDDEEALASARRFVDKYAAEMDKKPIYTVLRRSVPKIRDGVYEYSREVLGE